MVCRLQDDGSCPNGHTIWGAWNAARWSTRRRYVSTAASSPGRPRCARRLVEQFNSSDVDHENNNQTLAGQVAANSAVSNSAYGY